MHYKKIKKNVIKLIENKQKNAEKEDILFDIYALDSVGYLELICELEEKYNITFKEDYLGKIKNIEQITDYIYNNLKNKTEV